jgi:DNA-binding GntR family transcriptional regulator
MPNELTEAEKLAALDRAARDADESGDGELAYALNRQFAGALMTAYRANQLVLIGSDAVEALRANKQGWENAVEMGLLPPQHHDTARALIEQCRAALAALGVK